MIKTLALSGLETAINNYLRLDPVSLQRLSKLTDKVICVRLTDWEGEFFIFPDEDGIQLCAEHHGQVDATIHGKLFAMIRVIKAGANSQAIFANHIQVEGDTALAQELQTIMKQIDIDWEEHLSRLVGDNIAHRIAFGAKQILEYGRDALQKISTSVDAYIFDEKALFPKRDEVEQLYRDIATTRDNIDRAAARFDQLTKGKDQ